MNSLSHFVRLVEKVVSNESNVFLYSLNYFLGFPYRVVSKGVLGNDLFNLVRKILREMCIFENFIHHIFLLVLEQHNC